MSLFDAIRDAGLTVRADPGWESRGDDWREGQPIGIMMHHTAPPVPYPISGLNGSDGKLKCNINTKPDGTVWLVARDACNYSSGSGSSIVLNEVRASTPPIQNAFDRELRDDTNGNVYFWNFENDHPGDGSPIPQVQLEAIVTATRVSLDYFGLNPGKVISHAEWTARKVDPYWNGSYRAIEEIRNSIGDDMQTPDWAMPATKWHIDRGIYKETHPSDVDESMEFHRQTVFRHRFYEAIRSEIGGSDLTKAQVKAIVNDSQIVAPD